MIVTSVHDPAIFAPERFTENRHYLGRIVERLRIVANCHLMATDATDKGGSVIFTALQQIACQNTTIGMYLNAVLRPERCIRLPIDPTRHAKIRDIITSAGSAEAVALAGHTGVDTCILDEETFTATEMAGVSRTKLTTLADYHTSKAFQQEILAFGGKPVSDLTKEQFLQKIVRPVVYWAPQVIIIDKMIGKAAFGSDIKANTVGTPSTNWPQFNSTLNDIFKIWDKGVHSSGKRLRIITESVTNVMKDDQLVHAPELAIMLARRLTIPTDRVEIVLKNADAVKNIDHDRYLLTNHGFVIGISHGFDLLRSEDKCGVSDVYLRQAQSKDDILAQLTHSKKGTAGTYPPAHRLTS